MSGKNLSYWLKYGIILASIHIIVFIVLVTFVSMQNNNSPSYQYEPWPSAIVMIVPDFPMFFILDTPIASPIIKIFSNLFGTGNFGSNILIIVFGTLQWFLIGALIGWIVGKVKKK